MYISNIKIHNYRLLKNFSLDLNKSFSLILGKNNTGKTSLISLLDKFINKETFIFNDFSLIFQETLKNEISQTIVPEDYTEHSLSLELTIKYNGNDNLANFANLILDLDPEINCVHILFKYYLSYDGFLQLKTDYETFKKEVKNKFKKIPDNERFSLTNFLKKNIKKYFNIQSYSVEHNNPENMKEINKEDIRKIINLKIIKATREVSNDSGTQTLSRLSCNYFNSSEEIDEARRSLQIQLMDTDKYLDEIYEKIFNSIKENFNKFTNYKPNLSIKSFLKEDSLLENNTQILYNQGTGILPEEFNGLGYMNFFAILFELHIQLRDIRKSCIENDGKGIINLLFIEEPEVHTHPHMQYIFIKNIESLIKNEISKGITNIQTIVTTHSAHIVSLCDFNYIKYFLNTGDNIKAKNLNLLKGKDGTSNDKEALSRFKFFKRYLTVNTAEIFFADKVIFIEGTTERILLPQFIRKIDAANIENPNYHPLASQHISIIEVGTYSYLFEELIKFLDVKALIITDIDAINSETKEKMSLDNPNANVTSNPTLKHFLKTDKLQELLNKSFSEKTINDKIHITYQTEVEGYKPRSFEDAFIKQNYSFIKNNKENFDSIVNKKKINDTPDFYEIANKCIGNKASFACDILYHKQDWEIPTYIKEGLEWLAQ